MTPEQEDALVLGLGPVPDIFTIRLAIRAAVKMERERCAQLCEAFAEELRPYAEREYSRDDAIARDCANAIRKGD